MAGKWAGLWTLRKMFNIPFVLCPAMLIVSYIIQVSKKRIACFVHMFKTAKALKAHMSGGWLVISNPLK